MYAMSPWKRRQASLPIRRESYFEEWPPLAEFRRELDALMTEFFSEKFGDLAKFSGWAPGRPMEWDLGWEESDTEYTWSMELPGYEPDEIDVKLVGNSLTVQARHKEESSEEGTERYRYGEFYRTVTLPADVDAEKLDAEYHSGVLTLRLPKAEEFQGKRIEVKTR